MARLLLSLLSHQYRSFHIRFKLHLRPIAQSNAHVAHQLQPLPPGNSAIDVFADFLRYLHLCARTYIEETHANGIELWRTSEDCMYRIRSHSVQQSMMRTAAVRAGLIPDNENGHSHISFVTEGEASLHFCVQNGLTDDAI